MITICPNCRKPWNSSTDDMVQLFNHSTLHVWIDRNFEGTVEWTVRTNWVNPQQVIEHWITEELTEITQRLRAIDNVVTSR